MRGNLPVPLEKTLESNHGMYDNLECNLKLDANYTIGDVIAKLP